MQETNHRPASVISYSFASDNWIKGIRYTIKVVDTSGESEILRSAKDFKVLRKILVVRWPGCIIPMIPDEFSKSNPNTQLLPQCLIVHNLFIQKIAEKDYFYNSDVVKLFLNGPLDFIKLTNAYHIPNYPTIAENFENIFRDKLEYQMDEITLQTLHDRRETFKLQLKNVQLLEKAVNAQSNILKNFKASNKKMMDLVGGTFIWIDPEYPVNQYEFDHHDSAVQLITWLLEQMMSLQAIINAIEKIEELVRVKEITEKSINNTNLEIQKLALGKKSLSAIFNNKSKDDLLNAKKKNAEDLTNQSRALDIMIPILSSKLLNDDIPHIEQVSGAEYEKELKHYISMFCGDLSDFKRKLIKNMKNKLVEKDQGRPRDFYRETIENLRLQTQKLKEEITLESNAPLPVNTESYIARLQDQKDTYVKKINQEKQRGLELDKKISEVQKKIYDKKKSLVVPKDKKNKETNETILLKIKKTEHKLDKTLQKYNEALAHSAQLKTEIDSLRNEKNLTKKFLDNLEQEFEAKQKENAKAKEESSLLKKRSQELRTEIEKIRKEMNEAEEEKGKLERNWQELNKRMDKAIQLDEKSKKKKQNFELEENEMKMIEYIDESLVVESDSKKNAKDIARKMKLFEDAFKKMEEETGYSDVEKILKIFVEAEEHNYSLFSHVNELTKDIQNLESQIMEMRKEIDFYNSIGEKTAAERENILKQLEGKLNDTEKRADFDEKRYEKSMKMINTFKFGVHQLLEKICEGETVGEEGVNENNLMQYLGIIELRTNEILQMFKLCQRSSNDSPVESAQHEDEEKKPMKLIGPTIPENEHSEEESIVLQRHQFVEKANRLLDNKK